MTNSLTLTLGGSVELLLRPALPEISAIITATFGNFTVRGTDMAYTLPVNHQVTLRVDYVDSAGNPATIDGEVSWGSSSPDVTVTPDAGDSQQCTVAAAGVLTTAQVTAAADADLGTGARELVTFMDVAVIAGEAVAGTISPVGEPTPVP